MCFSGMLAPYERASHLLVFCIMLIIDGA